MTRTISLSILATGLLAYGCASAPPSGDRTAARPRSSNRSPGSCGSKNQRMLRGEVHLAPARGSRRTPRNRRAPAAASVRAGGAGPPRRAHPGRSPRAPTRGAGGRAGRTGGWHRPAHPRAVDATRIPKCGRWRPSRSGSSVRRRATAALVAALKDPSPLVQGRAAEALGAIGAKAHAADIAAMMRPHVDAGVLRAIAPDDLTYPLAPRGRGGSAWGVRVRTPQSVRRACFHRRSTPEGQPVSEWWPVAYALGRAEDPRAAAALTVTHAERWLVHARVRRARAGSREGLSGCARAAAARGRRRAPAAGGARGGAGARGPRGARAAAPVLVRVMGGPALDPAFRTEVITALGRVRIERATASTLLDFLTDPAPGVRAAAFRALGAIDREAFLSALSGLEPDRHWTVRAAVASALGTLDPEQAVPLLDAPAEGCRISARCRRCFAALAAVKAPDVERLLLDHLRADDPSCALPRRPRSASCGRPALPRHSRPRIARPSGTRPMWRAAPSSARSRSTSARRAEPTLTAALADKDWAVRVRAASLLQTIDPARNPATAIRPAPTTVDAATIASSPHRVAAVLHRTCTWTRTRAPSRSSSRCSTRR